MKTLIFDIETGPLAESRVLEFLPEFRPPGNIKDPEKIKAREIEARAEFIERAALDARTGRVLAIGTIEDGRECIATGDEDVIIGQFWQQVRGAIHTGGVIVGFNSHLFDLPFLIRRSWALGIEIPKYIREKGKYWTANSIDLREAWQLGDRQAHGSLDTIAKFLMVGTKSGTGADFAQLLANDREAALKYVSNDLQLTAEIYRRLIA